MHLRTHTKPESVGQAGRWQSPYHDTMIDHDKNVGQLLDLLDELGIAEDTIVIYSTDNGPHMNTWPDGAMTPFRSEKDTNWEGAFRVPRADPLARQDPGRRRSPTRSSSTTTGCRRSWPRPASPTSSRSCKEGHKAGDKTFKVHIDGYNLLPYLTGEAKKSPREGFIYFSDDGDLVALRFDNWKVGLHGAARARARCRSGPSRSSRCGSRSSSTCAPTRSSGPTSPRTPTGTGSCRRTT